MELKVWCDGIQRVVCGASGTTTCQDIVFALAHATGQTGRFILIEKWRNNERVLAPNDRPLASLAKWGEYSNDVTFVMKRSGDVSKSAPNTSSILNKKSDTDLVYKQRDYGTLLNNDKPHSEAYKTKSMPLMPSLRHSNTLPLKNKQDSFVRSPSLYSSEKLKSSSLPSENPIAYLVENENYANTDKMNNCSTNKSSPMYNESIYASISKNRPRQPPPYQEAIAKSTLVNIINTSAVVGNNFNGHNSCVKHNVVSSQYEFNLQHKPTATQTNQQNNKEISDSSLLKANKHFNGQTTTNAKSMSSLHHETINLIDMQKKTMQNQERDIVNIEQEIDVVQRKLSQNEFIVKRYKDEMELLRQLWVEQEMLIEKLESENMEEDLDRLIKEGKQFEDEMRDIKDKLCNCENEVVKCREEICKLMNRIDDAYNHKSIDSENSDDISVLDRLSSSIQDKNNEIESQKRDLETLNNSIEKMDKTIQEKTSLIDQLVIEIKEANVEGLTLQSVALFVEEKNSSGSDQSTSKCISNRKIPVSPQELGNTVPTKKNPDGIWV